MNRNETIKRIKTALQKRSGKSWSVTGGRGTAWGWLRIDAPPARRRFNFDGTPATNGHGYMGPEDREELAKLLGLERMHQQGEQVPSSNAYYQEYIDRAEGRAPSVIGQPYWD